MDCNSIKDLQEQLTRLCNIPPTIQEEQCEEHHHGHHGHCDYDVINQLKKIKNGDIPGDVSSSSEVSSLLQDIYNDRTEMLELIQQLQEARYNERSVVNEINKYKASVNSRLSKISNSLDNIVSAYTVAIGNNILSSTFAKIEALETQVQALKLAHDTFIENYTPVISNTTKRNMILLARMALNR